MRHVEVVIWDLGRESRRWEALWEALWDLCLGLEVRATGAVLGLGGCEWLNLNSGGLEDKVWDGSRPRSVEECWGVESRASFD